MAEDEDVTDKRDSSRCPLITFCWYSVVGESGSDHEGLARSCDISKTGVGVVTSKAVPVGQYVFIEVATGAGQLSAIGKVMYCSPIDGGSYRVGLRLDIVPPTDMGILAAMVAE